MRVILSPRAEKQLRKLPKIDAFAIAKKIRALRDNKTPYEEEKLSGFKSVFRTRIGDYRLVYKKAGGEIYIILIGHRKDVYQLVERLLG